MNPQMIQAWVPIAQQLIAIGVNLVSSLKAILSSAHPQLTEEQLNAAYVAILTDDALRSAWAEKAAQP